MATKLDEALLIELGISDDRLNRELARAYAKAIRDNRKLEAELDRVTNGAVERMSDGFERMGMDAQRSTRVATAGVIGLGDAMQRARPQIQNAAFQIGDFATQVAGGTRASTALAQQLPQLLGGFGAIGAVLGAAAAVGIPLFAAGLSSMGDQVADTDKALDEFVKSLDEYREFLALAGASTLELEETFGSFANQMRGFAEYMASVQLGKTMTEFAEAMEPVRTGLEGVVDLVRRYADAQQLLNEEKAREQVGSATVDDVLRAQEAMETFAQAAMDAAAEFGLLPAQAVELEGALDALASANGITEMRDRAAEALDMIQRWYPAGQELSPVLADIVTQLQEIAGEAAKTTAQMEGMHGNLQLAAGAANALAGGLAAAQGPAANLLAKLQQVATAAWQAAYAMAVTDDFRAQNQALGDDERGSQRIAVAGARQYNTEEAIRRANERLQAQLAAQRPSGGSPGGASPGAGNAVAQAPEYWDELIQKVREGEQAWEDYNRTVERGANAMADFFTSIVDGSKSAKEALADLLIQLAQVQFQKAFLGLAGGGGTIGNIFGALGNALTVPSFDGGGYTGGGARTGGIDGKGGFPALLHPNETVIDHTKPGNAGGGQVSVVVRMDGGNLVPVIESVSGNVTAKAMANYDRQLNARIRQANGDRRAL
jgi:hypothetical protein